MTLSTEARTYMAKRDELSDGEKYVINSLFDELYARAKALGLPAAKDDRAAELEAALIRFLIDSRPQVAPKGWDKV
jgi:hypothetical protein